MAETQELVKATMGEIEKVLSTKTVFGEPMTFGDKTIIPLMSAGFGFGAGGGTGPTSQGMGGGAGGGAGVQPVGIIIIDATGVRIEPVKHGIGAAIEKMAEMMPEMMMKMAEKRHEMHHGWRHGMGMHGMHDMEEKPEEEQEGKA
jgi:uncharacterized spore protein YtfJ